MFTLLSRIPRRAAMLAVLALAIASPLLLADGASATNLSGTHSRGEIMGACAAAGGNYNDNGLPSGSVSGAHYGCTTDVGSVQCDDGGHCVGGCKNCPDRQPTKGTGTVGGVLGNSAGVKAGNASATSTAAQHKSGLTGTTPVVAVDHLPVKKITGGATTLRRAH